MEDTTKKNVCSVAIQKGGGGKSTSCHAIGYEFADKGYNVVLVDLDPQATLTKDLIGLNDYNGFTGDDESNITRLFEKKDVKPLKITTTRYIDNPLKGKMHQPHYLEEPIEINFIPSNRELLDAIEGDNYKKEEKINLITQFIEKLSEKYDKVVIDSPPSFGIITKAILKSSNAILVPIPTKNVDTGGMMGFFDDLDNLYGNNNMKLEKIVVLPNMHDSRINDSKETLSSIKLMPNLLQQSKNLRDIKCVVKNAFPYKACVQEAPSYKMFLVPFIMSFARKEKDLTLKIKDIAEELENI